MLFGIIKVNNAFIISHKNTKLLYKLHLFSFLLQLMDNIENYTTY